MPAYAGGGGRPRSSGTMGSAARNIAAIRLPPGELAAGRSRPVGALVGRLVESQKEVYGSTKGRHGAH